MFEHIPVHVVRYNSKRFCYDEVMTDGRSMSKFSEIWADGVDFFGKPFRRMDSALGDGTWGGKQISVRTLTPYGIHFAFSRDKGCGRKSTKEKIAVALRATYATIACDVRTPGKFVYYFIPNWLLLDQLDIGEIGASGHWSATRFDGKICEMNRTLASANVGGWAAKNSGWSWLKCVPPKWLDSYLRKFKIVQEKWYATC